MTDAASSRSQSPATARKNVGQASEPAKSRPSSEKRREAHRVAEELFHQRPDWVVFFREVLGVGGVVPRLFPSQDELAAFKQTSEYAAIQKMLADLRNQGPYGAELDDKEPTRVITVRLPRSMHEALRAEAYSRQISMNKLCISKLLQALEDAEAEESNRNSASTPEEA